ncbi:MAG: hypothetical protein LBN22_08160 [Clostridiales Family XIII bacterium]|nr:hypothetical protein [Clostridiales Family XIII bacterium]
MKRLSIAVILIVAMIGTMAFSACSKSDSGSDSGDSKDSTKGDKIKMGFTISERSISFIAR